MTTFVLIPGAACDSWHWHLLEEELRSRGRDVVSVDLPCEDDAAGLDEYADAVVRAVAGRGRLTLVAHSFAGFTAPLVCARVPVDLLVLLAAMVPLPGEAPAEWWRATRHPDSRVRRAGREAQRAGAEPGGGRHPGIRCAGFCRGSVLPGSAAAAGGRGGGALAAAVRHPFLAALADGVLARGGDAVPVVPSGPPLPGTVPP
ncbi:alpha/beta fold hydrolase [Streptomyces lydicus]|nr:alpha/beta fold hydrolase [Streptomyces lydicus]